MESLRLVQVVRQKLVWKYYNLAFVFYSTTVVPLADPGIYSNAGELIGTCSFYLGI